MHVYKHLLHACTHVDYTYFHTYIQRYFKLKNDIFHCDGKAKFAECIYIICHAQRPSKLQHVITTVFEKLQHWDTRPCAKQTNPLISTKHISRPACCNQHMHKHAHTHSQIHKHTRTHIHEHILITFSYITHT